ncbi:uncharacterized protein LOC129588249 [Paramacrobiotus metropolitanus]|uniref:uncharacterized protein LOC129588249 n=1 Tax=Paramacrobiotus metropolitanus TaxID=2943436 RepID=UPI00244562E8|nr:uncharacterized protein LOC129588249 [Paramacrobiotus metropolitanus]
MKLLDVKIIQLAFVIYGTGVWAVQRLDEEDRQHLDDDIPADWRDYVALDMLKSFPVKDRSNGLLQGDIAGIDPSMVVNFGPTQFNAVNDENLLWPNGLIPYEMSRQFRNVDVDFIKQALAGIEAKTCVRFIPRKYEEDFIAIIAGLDCSSMVGRQGSRQEVSMNRGCRDGLGATQHEFLHVLGFYHEHARSDRDQYIWINHRNLNNDDSPTMLQFLAKTPQQATTLDTPYDYESAMHYGWNAFAVNRNYPTILPKQKGKRIGQRDHLSDTDILRINKLYRCEAYLNKEKPKPVQISEVSYDDDEQEWWILCNGKVDREGGWDENPDVCLKLCDKIDNALYPNLWVGDRYSGKRLFNLPTTKRCMQKSWLCDGIQDSPDDVSEDKETCKKFCKGGGYVAIAPSYQCVHFTELCDGKIANAGRPNGAGDGSDEDKDNCIKYCQQPDMQDYGGRLFNLAPTQRCMLKTWLCDGIKDNDPNDTSEDPENCKKYCTGSGHFPAGDNFQCIIYSWLCDGRKDTRTGWDEVKGNCLSACPKVPGMDGELFNLEETSGQCLHKRTLCNAQIESGQVSTNNEDICEKYCKGSLFFPAEDTKQCLRATDLCDGKLDTKNGWDETPKNCRKYCNLMNTEQNLFVNPRSRRCLIKPRARRSLLLQ